MAEEKIVEAVFTSANSGGLHKSPLAKLIEQAMSDAVTECHKAGIHDPDKVREAMLAARANMKAWFKEQEARAAAEYAKQMTAEG